MSLPPPSAEPQRRRRRVRSVLGAALLVLTGVFLCVAVVRNWSAVREDIGRLSPGDWVLTTLLGAVAMVGTWGIWSTVLSGMGAHLGGHDSRVVFFAGQLGKYVPGSIWPAVIQARMGARHGIRAGTMVASYGYAIAMSVSVGGIMGLAALASVRAGSGVWLIVGFAVGAGAGLVLLLHPRGVPRALAAVAARTGRDVEFVAPSRNHKLLAAVLSAASWGAFGLHAWAIARPLGAGPGDIAVVVGGFALAFVSGILFIPVPGGAGVREAIQVVTIGAVIGRPGALTLALISRFVLMLLELALAALAGAVPLIRAARSEAAGVAGGALDQTSVPT